MNYIIWKDVLLLFKSNNRLIIYCVDVERDIEDGLAAIRANGSKEYWTNWKKHTDILQNESIKDEN